MFTTKDNNHIKEYLEENKDNPQELKNIYKSILTEDLIFFSNNLLGFDKINAHTHELINSYLSTHPNQPPPPVTPSHNMCTPRINHYVGLSDDGLCKTLVMAPRGSYKTTIGTICKPIYELAYDPDCRILIESNLQDLSGKSLIQISQIILNNKRLLYFFPHMRPKKGASWCKSEITVNRKGNFKEPSIMIGGLDTDRTGFHYKLIIVDDMVTQGNVTTPDQIQKVIQHIQEYIPLLEPGGQLWVIGTNWSDKDAYTFIQEEMLEEFNIILYGAVDEKGTLFLPDVLSEKVLESKRRVMGAYLFSCQYMNDPVPASEQEFKPSWRSRAKRDLFPNPETRLREIRGNRYIKRVMTIDPSRLLLGMGSKGQRNRALRANLKRDFTAVTVAGFTERMLIEVFDGILANYKTMSYKQLAEKVIDLIILYDIDEVGIEDRAYSDILQYILLDQRAKRDVWTFNIVPLKDKRVNKLVRLQGLLPVFENEKIVFDKNINSTYMVELDNELKRFPVMKYDDIMDTLRYLLDLGYDPSYDDDDELRCYDPETGEIFNEEEYYKILWEKEEKLYRGESIW